MLVNFRDTFSHLWTETGQLFPNVPGLNAKLTGCCLLLQIDGSYESVKNKKSKERKSYESGTGVS